MIQALEMGVVLVGLSRSDVVDVCVMLSAHWSKALHRSARGVTTDPGSIPGCFTTIRDWEFHRVAHNWPSVVRLITTTLYPSVTPLSSYLLNDVCTQNSNGPVSSRRKLLLSSLQTGRLKHCFNGSIYCLSSTLRFTAR